MLGITCCSIKKRVLKNGMYKIVYDEEFSTYPNFEFIVQDKILTPLNTDENIAYEINWISDNQFRLITSQIRTDTLNEFEKLLNSSGIPFYEIIDNKKDTIFFIFRVDMHVIINSGKIFKTE